MKNAGESSNIKITSFEYKVIIRLRALRSAEKMCVIKKESADAWGIIEFSGKEVVYKHPLDKQIDADIINNDN